MRLKRLSASVSWDYRAGKPRWTRRMVVFFGQQQAGKSTVKSSS